MTDFDVWNADQRCRSAAEVAELRNLWVILEGRGMDCSEITRVMDAHAT